ncbi:MAG: hypothetical protein H5T97_04795 [Firmicutes bacterium]|nr:hypothetical protein [Bacillota bacterium]
MQTSLWLYRLYDIADEIALDRVEGILGQEKPVSRLRLARVRPEAIVLRNPPVAVELGEGQFVLGGEAYRAAYGARIYDLGVVSIIVRLTVPPGDPYGGMRKLALLLAETDELDPVFAEQLGRVRRVLAPALVRGSQREVMEEFVIFYFREWRPEWDPVPLLLGEDEPVSPQLRQDLLRHSFSYTPEDLTIISFDGALVYEAEGSTDVPDLLEMARAQLLELRYYDGVLTEEVDRMYDAIEDVARAARFRRLGHYRRIMTHLMELVVDITEFTERLHNSLKVTEDMYYARIYTAALGIFRTKMWMESIERRLAVIQQSYSLLSNEVITQRFIWLESAIVILFVLEIILGLLPFFK